MATTIEISKKTTLPPEKIRKGVDNIFADLANKCTLYGGWKNKDIFFLVGQGMAGTFTICDDSVEVKIVIDGVLSAFASIIESHVKQELCTQLDS